MLTHIKSAFFTMASLLVLVIVLASTPIIVTIATVMFGILMMIGFVWLIYAIIHDTIISNRK